MARGVELSANGVSRYCLADSRRLRRYARSFVTIAG